MNDNKELEVNKHPISLIIIPIFYGFMAFMSILGTQEQYILFSFFLPRSMSMVIVLIETFVLLFLTVGIFKRRVIARKVLIGYNIFAIADILVTLTFIKKETLLEFVNDAVSLEEFANVNLIFCFILFIILRHVRKHNEYFID